MIISVLISFLGPQARKKKENAKFVCLTATCLNGEKNGLTKRATGQEKEKRMLYVQRKNAKVVAE